MTDAPKIPLGLAIREAAEAMEALATDLDDGARPADVARKLRSAAVDARNFRMNPNLDALVAQINDAQAVRDQVGRYVALCPVPAALTGEARIDLLEIRERLAQFSIKDAS